MIIRRPAGCCSNSNRSVFQGALVPLGSYKRSLSERHEAARNSMKKTARQHNHDGMRSEYDFASMKGGVRGKHYREYRNGTNVVLLQPDVAKAFPTEDAVNEALRGILTTTRAVRRTGGLPDRAVGSTPSASKPDRRK
jgi:hypothetical protein